ncbi:hypothetical protein Bbelb_408970 [Branchiostoma belcheri]|nr:hypothetical protein Bbelb_408970 [Branchiostoma belcheri]
MSIATSSTLRYTASCPVIRDFCHTAKWLCNTLWPTAHPTTLVPPPLLHEMWRNSSFFAILARLVQQLPGSSGAKMAICETHHTSTTFLKYKTGRRADHPIKDCTTPRWDRVKSTTPRQLQIREDRYHSG